MILISLPQEENSDQRTLLSCAKHEMTNTWLHGASLTASSSWGLVNGFLFMPVWSTQEKGWCGKPHPEFGFSEALEDRIAPSSSASRAAMRCSHTCMSTCAHKHPRQDSVCLRVTDMTLTKCVRAKDDIFGVRACFHAHDLYASVFGSLWVLFCNQWAHVGVGAEVSDWHFCFCVFSIISAPGGLLRNTDCQMLC